MSITAIVALVSCSCIIAFNMSITAIVALVSCCCIIALMSITAPSLVGCRRPSTHVSLYTFVYFFHRCKVCGPSRLQQVTSCTSTTPFSLCTLVQNPWCTPVGWFYVLIHRAIMMYSFFMATKICVLTWLACRYGNEDIHVHSSICPSLLHTFAHITALR